MYIHSVELINYKSIGSENAKIILEPGVTAIVGKNESGKSNILSGLAGIDLLGDILEDDPFEGNINRNISKTDKNAEIKFRIVLKATDEEKREYKELEEDTVIEITADSYILKGGYESWYKIYFIDDVQFLKKEAEKLFKGTKYYELSLEILNWLRSDKLCIAHKVFLSKYFCKKFICETISPPKNETLTPPERETFFETLYLQNLNALRFIGRLLVAFKFIPRIEYIHSAELKAEYSLEEIRAISDFSILSYLEDILEIKFEEAIKDRTAEERTHNQDEINERIEEGINIPFSKLYKTDSIKLSVKLKENGIAFFVQSYNGLTLPLSARSDGFRSCLGTFIKIAHHSPIGYKFSNEVDFRKGQDPTFNYPYILLLFDEPGTGLHVNAQKELLNFFNALAETGYQVAYTTHSPYMLDLENNGIESVRAAVKDENGNTAIYNSVYNPNIAKDAQQDTLAPVMNALGMSLNTTFGPAFGKLNIVTEGMSDCIYLRMMARLCENADPEKIADKTAIIPAVGAENVKSICAMLHGWGCNYVALFDYDNEGVRCGEEIRRKWELNYKENYLYIYDASEEDIRNRSYNDNPRAIESLFVSETDDLETFRERFGLAKDTGKGLVAKLMSQKVKDCKFMVSDGTKANFENLFNRMLNREG